METLLISGGCGFVGSNLAVRFKDKQPELRVVALDNLKRRGSELNVPRLQDHGVEFIHGDIRNREDLHAAGPFDCIMECSAEPSVLAGYNSSPDYIVNTNLLGTINCLEVARKHSADFIFLSTSRVYPIAHLRNIRLNERETRYETAPYQELPGVSLEGINELFPLDGPRSLYGATKLASELLLQEYIDIYGLRGVVNRCGVISGPWQMGKEEQGVVALWVARHLWGRGLNYIGFGGSGKQVRDILAVDDLFEFLIRQIEMLDSINGQVFNVGGGPEMSISLLELTALCSEVVGRQIPIGTTPETRPGDVPFYVTDCSKIHSHIEWKPKKSLQDIVLDITGWLRANESSVRKILG